MTETTTYFHGQRPNVFKYITLSSLSLLKAYRQRYFLLIKLPNT